MPGLTIKSSGANRFKIAKIEPERERGPPPPPTPLEFPPTTLNQTPKQPRPYTSLEIFQLFSKIHKIKSKIEHLQALSTRSIEVSLEQLLPEGYLPHESWNQDPSATDDVLRAPVYRPPPSTLSNGREPPGYETWSKSAKELLYNNQDVFQFLQGRHPSSGQPKVRVAIFRKFWDHLREIGLYWDTSNEKYEDIPSDAVAAEVAPDAMDMDPISAQTQPTQVTKDGKAKKTYRGNRIGTGRDMPARYREDAVCAFVDTVAMAFYCRTERPQIQPKLKLQNLFIPVPQAAIVYRCPKDRNQARRGILEGPLLAVQCNHHTAFRQQEEEGKAEELNSKKQGITVNLLREVGLMLNLAQKRAREGQEEPVPGEEQWWATKPRWGGGPGGEVPRKEGKIIGGGGGGGVGPKRSAVSKARTNKAPGMENWENLEAGPKRWDQGVLHLQIGKDPDVIGDDVRLSVYPFFFSFFSNMTVEILKTPNRKNKLTMARPIQIYLISALNHHLSILHLRVHPEYIQHLNSEPSRDDFVPSTQPWYDLNVQRSRWFDLFVAEDRIQAMRGVWGVFAYLMRGGRCEG